jgi:hypothetical protein
MRNRANDAAASWRSSLCNGMQLAATGIYMFRGILLSAVFLQHTSAGPGGA